MAFNKWCKESRTSARKRKKLDVFLLAQTKINSKFIKGLNMQSQTSKENTGERPHDIALGNDFIDTTSAGCRSQSRVGKDRRATVCHDATKFLQN